MGYAICLFMCGWIRLASSLKWATQYYPLYMAIKTVSKVVDMIQTFGAFSDIPIGTTLGPFQQYMVDYPNTFVSKL